MNMYVDWELLTKYFQKRCTGDELKQVEDWRNSTPDHQRFFEELAEIWQQSGDLFSSYQADKEAAWSKLTGKLSIESRENRPGIRTIIKWAAMVAVLISLGLLAKHLLPEQNVQQEIRTFRAEAEKTDIILPDSSQVTLDKYSVIQFTNEFEGNLRTVELKGTAFFNVRSDEQKPFIVNIGACVAKVVGTSFYLISDSSANKVSLIVTSGKVNFYVRTKTDSFVVVSKNEKAVYWENKSEIRKYLNYDANEIAWKTGNFLFEGKVLKEVCHKLSSFYKTDITLADTSLNSLKLTARFYEKSLPEIIDAIKATFDLNADTVDNKIRLTKNKTSE